MLFTPLADFFAAVFEFLPTAFFTFGLHVVVLVVIIVFALNNSQSLYSCILLQLLIISKICETFFVAWQFYTSVSILVKDSLMASLFPNILPYRIFQDFPPHLFHLGIVVLCNLRTCYAVKYNCYLPYATFHNTLKLSIPND